MQTKWLILSLRDTLEALVQRKSSLIYGHFYISKRFGQNYYNFILHMLTNGTPLFSLL